MPTTAGAAGKGTAAAATADDRRGTHDDVASSLAPDGARDDDRGRHDPDEERWERWRPRHDPVGSTAAGKAEAAVGERAFGAIHEWRELLRGAGGEEGRRARRPRILDGGELPAGGAVLQVPRGAWRWFSEARVRPPPVTSSIHL